LAKYPLIPARLRKIDELTRLDHFHICEDDDCYYLWEWDGAPYSESAITDFIGNFQKEMRFKDSGYPWQCKRLAIRHAANAITRTLLPDWGASTFVPVPPSKTKGDSRHDPRLLEALRLVSPSLPSVSELVIQLENTQSREKGLSPMRRAANWNLDLTSLAGEPGHFVVFDDLLTGGSHFAAMKIVLGREFPNVGVSALFLARRVPQPLQDMSA
jgi:hypothetical protein